MKNILFIFALIVSSSLFGQAVFTSTCGYTVTVYIKPMEIITKTIYDGGYGYEVKYHYDIVIGGIPTCGDNSLYDFQTYITCLKTSKTSGSYTDLPKGLVNSSGSLQTSNNQQAKQTGILPLDATVDNFLCNDINVTISGPGLPPQTKSLNPGALPIELHSFKATVNQSQVDLSWATASEKSNDFFTIERSSDGIAYEEVVKIEGRGNSSTEISYKHTDVRPLHGVSYYRLKQTDFNGESEVFEPVSVYFINTKDYIKLYPNPNKGSFELEFYSNINRDNVELTILDSQGKVVLKRLEKVKGGLTVKNLNLSSGVYIVNFLGFSERLVILND